MQEDYTIPFKQKVYDRCKQLINDKLFMLQQTLADLVTSTNNETKSSAGDKYETGRAMLQIEQDNLRKQLGDALEQKANLDNIKATETNTQIVRGSLVKTDKSYFFICLALGKVVIDGRSVFAISPHSPLGSKLMKSRLHENVTMKGLTYTIESIE